MPRIYAAGLLVVASTVVALGIAVNAPLAGPQDRVKEEPSPETKAKTGAKAVPVPATKSGPNLSDPSARMEVITKMLAGYDVNPHPEPAIPDDPPPHEGAMIDYPNTVEPSDLVIVEVIEALPGRPISGERLVRPDGTISLGFYGDVHVRGLTVEQVKVKIIKHLRLFIDDAALGLESPTYEKTAGVPAMKFEKAPMPGLPKGESPLDLNEGKSQTKPRSSSIKPGAARRSTTLRSAGFRRSGDGVISVHRVRAARAGQEAHDGKTAKATQQHQITIPAGGGPITITIQTEGQDAVLAPAPPAPAAQQPDDAVDEQWTIIPPEKSATVYVDISAYNTKNYYVEGDVLVTGRLPWTGHETVADALCFAGGLMSTAEPKDVRLVRPARGGRPVKVYKIDLEAIREQGDASVNYQLFPGDRLIVGRNEVVKRTVEMDRLAAPIQTITGTLTQEATLLRSLQTLTPSDERTALMRELVDLWAKALAREGDGKLDEQALREVLLRALKAAPGGLPAAPAR